MRLSNVFVNFVLFIILLIICTYFVGNVVHTKKEKKDIEKFIKNEVSVDDASSFISVLEIPKINLKKGLYDVNSPLNDVDKNVEINKKSDMPDILNGNFILEAHSGLSFVSYFKNLEKLTKGDLIKVYYDNVVYLYEIDHFYDIPKTGTAALKRDYSRTAITLITCKKDDSKQIVYIGYLKEKSS